MLLKKSFPFGGSLKRETIIKVLYIELRYPIITRGYSIITATSDRQLRGFAGDVQLITGNPGSCSL